MAAVVCKRKLNEILERQLDSLMYTCGASLQDLKLRPPLDEVYVRDVTCADHIEKLYFSAGYEPICIYCAGAVDEVNSDFFPSVLWLCTTKSCPVIGSHSKPTFIVLTSFLFVSYMYWSSFYATTSYIRTCVYSIFVCTGNCLAKIILWMMVIGNAYTIMNNDNDCCCGDEKQWISLEWPYPLPIKTAKAADLKTLATKYVPSGMKDMYIDLPTVDSDGDWCECIANKETCLCAYACTVCMCVCVCTTTMLLFQVATSATCFCGLVLGCVCVRASVCVCVCVCARACLHGSTLEVKTSFVNNTT